jgi:hypothetical protein
VAHHQTIRLLGNTGMVLGRDLTSLHNLVDRDFREAQREHSVNTLAHGRLP